MFQMPFSRKGVTYPMASSTYYKNLAVLSVLLVGSVILYAVGQGYSDAPAQLRAAGSYAMPVSIYLFGALIGIIFVRRSSMTVPAAVQSGCRAASLLVVMTLSAALVPYLSPQPPQGMTLPAVLSIVDIALGLAYAVAWAPVTGSPADLAAREAEEQRRTREAEEERAAMKASSEARAKRREERARRAEEKRAGNGQKGSSQKASGQQGPSKKSSSKKNRGKKSRK